MAKQNKNKPYKTSLGTAVYPQVITALDEVTESLTLAAGNKSRSISAGIAMLYNCDQKTREEMVKRIAIAEIDGDWSKVFRPQNQMLKMSAKKIPGKDAD